MTICTPHGRCDTCQIASHCGALYEWKKKQEIRTMSEIVMRLKSGREFRFKCEEYTIKTFKLDGTLSEFSYKGGVGECPIYFQEQDIECIAIIGKEKNNDKSRSD